MKGNKSILLCIPLYLGILINCSATNVIISSNSKHNAIDCAGPTIDMQVDNPNPNYDYHWHYVLLDTSLGSCSFDNWTNLIGYGTTINVPTNMGNFFAIVCYADSGGMLWDDSHWFKVRNTSLKAPVCLPASQNGPCGERNATLLQVFYLDSNNTYVNLQWLKNGSPINPSGINTPFDVTLNSTGYYCLRAQVGNCGFAYSDSIHVQVNRPAPVITAGGPTTFCNGNTVLLSTNNTAGASYQWKKNGTTISGATSATFSADASGNYKVVKTNAQGCSGTSAVTSVTVNNSPLATVTAQGPTTFCAGDSVQLKANYNSNYTYQWKKNNVNISGANTHKFEAKAAGNYKVKVTNTNGCTKISAPVQVSVPCRNAEFITDGSDQVVSIYPNPNSGEFTLKFSAKPISSVQIELSDQVGKILKRFDTQDESVVIKESNLENGIYCLIIHTKDEMVVKKINVVR